MRDFLLQSWRHAGLAVLLLLVVSCIAPVTAIGVSGAIYKGSIPPGGTDSFKMTVVNGAGENPVDIQAGVMGFGQGADQGYFALDPAKDTSPYSARNFISLDNTSFHLGPGTKQDIIATITLPQNVGTGGRYAIIYIHAVPENGAPISTAVNVPVLVTIAGSTQTLTGSITTIDASGGTGGEPLVVTTGFQNTGNVHYYSTVNKVTITNTAGNLIANVSLAPSVFAIIPGSTINYTAKADVTNLPYGNYTIKSDVLLPGGQVLDEKTTQFVFQQPSSPVITSTNAPPSAGVSTQSPGSTVSPTGTPTKASLPVALSTISFAAATIIFGATVGRRK